MNREERARRLGHANRRHGQATPGKRGPAYRSWESMKSRCNNPNDPSFPDYGGRGISVFSAWSDSFEAFDKDMGERPRGTTLDRIDVNRNYEPGNCRWADAKTQGRNRRCNQRVEWQGQTMTMVELSERTGVPYQRLHERIVRRGWPVTRAVSEAPRGWRQQDTPPGPHAMTAQAGAVAAWVDPDDFPLDANGTCVDLYPNQIGDAYVPLYRNPPAAVPVEALEGLLDKAQFLVDGLDEEYVAWPTRVLMLRTELTELTQLIKERSNG